MTMQGAITELVNILNDKNLPIYYEPALKKVIETLEQEPCEDAISRQAVIDAIDKWVKAEHILETLPTDKVTPLFKSVVHKLPSVNPQLKTGHWVRTTNALGDDIHVCSSCGKLIKQGYLNFCANCGCRMVEPQESEVSDADSN